MLVLAVLALASARGIDLVVVAAPPDDVQGVRDLLASHGLDEPVPGRPAYAVVVPGGASRQDSVAAALHSLPEDVDVVLVHDAARPLAPQSLVDAVVAAVRAGAPAVVPGVCVADTVKRVGPTGVVAETLDRSVLRSVQTPQGFSRSVLAGAHAAADPDTPATDDAGLVEAAGVVVSVIAGDEEAFKVTRPIDLVLAEAVLARRRAAGVVG
jgi:2-C-methyl-D-erythritol 4-phosphate cytidylyltransferase